MFNILSEGTLTKMSAIKLLKTLNLPEAYAKLIVQTALLKNAKEKKQL